MKESKLLSRDQILKVRDIEIEKVEVPEWGGHVYVKTMSGKERDLFEVNQVIGESAEDKYGDIRARMAAMTICNEKGELLFDYNDIMALGKKSVAALNRVFSVAQRLSRLKNVDVEEMSKNSPSDQDDDSSLDSPSS